MLSLKKVGREQEGGKGWNWMGRVRKQANKKEKKKERNIYAFHRIESVFRIRYEIRLRTLFVLSPHPYWE
jgi:hypothetical protein